MVTKLLSGDEQLGTSLNLPGNVHSLFELAKIPPVAPILSESKSSVFYRYPSLNIGRTINSTNFISVQSKKKPNFAFVSFYANSLNMVPVKTDVNPNIVFS